MLRKVIGTILMIIGVCGLTLVTFFYWGDIPMTQMPLLPIWWPVCLMSAAVFTLGLACMEGKR